jgi:hypothetical protein
MKKRVLNRLSVELVLNHSSIVRKEAATSKELRSLNRNSSPKNSSSKQIRMKKLKRQLS